MQNKNKPKYGLTPSSSRKAINSPSSSHGSVVKSSSHKTLRQPQSTRAARKELSSTVRVAKYLSASNVSHGSFDHKSSASCENDARLRRGEEPKSCKIKAKIPQAIFAPIMINKSNTAEIAVAGKAAKHHYGPSKVKQSAYCPSKAVRDQVFDSLHPFNAEQIMATTGRAKRAKKDTDTPSKSAAAEPHKWRTFTKTSLAGTELLLRPTVGATSAQRPFVSAVPSQGLTHKLSQSASLSNSSAQTAPTTADE